uniref:Uncharacterized protein n=1 Tax=Pseudomonas fluorescens (strain SBW25) TaxID=216595 RepID=A0A0G4E5N0_PSEFS|nr:hypothetical protein [Pseudomonas fluorescens]CEK42541.1 hypothetical protein PQBR55_0162 [Pseudomonas fluorescens SBW25]
MNSTPHAASLADWQARYEDKAALVKSPEAHQFVLDELAGTLHARGVIDDAGLADLAEQSNAAYQWGVEEQLSDELNQPEAN